MYPKGSFVTSLFILCCLTALCGRSTASYCSLDRMKKLAMEACEHLFETFDMRERRSINHGHNVNSADNSESEKFYHYVRRSTYPQGGYLKMGLNHYRRLSQLDISPRYKAKKLSQLHHDEKFRFKRNEESYSNSISYCCYHKCDEDFFC
ncbi:insulin-like peptide 8 [Haematobia irritans]|uniref:insulin-like peptide 8 n=1 Tax=Haematobia irritans TaxID=7368 RepID=UPI003F500756